MAKCVHTEHCHWDGCKYGEEDWCPVYLGLKEPSYPNYDDGLVSYEVPRPTEEEFQKRRDEAESKYEI